MRLNPGMESPLHKHLRQRQLSEVGASIYHVEIHQTMTAPPGLTRMGTSLFRGGPPWDEVPDPTDEPTRFFEWAQGWTNTPLRWEGDDT